MKAIVDQEMFENLLSRGAMSALSDTAQSDTTGVSPLIKSVKITLDSNNLTVESATDRTSIRVAIPSKKENGVDLKDEGVAVVAAKEILDWVSKQTGSKIGISISKLDVPETVEVDGTDVEDMSKNPVKKIADFKISSKDTTNTGSKWSLDSYDPDQLPISTITSTNKKVLFKVDPKKMLEIINRVVFSILPKDYQHVFDSFVFEKVGQDLFIGACDKKRCALYKLTGVISNFGEYFSEEGSKILIPAYNLQDVIKNADESKEVTLFYDESKHTLFIEQENMMARLAIPDKNVYKGFPSLVALVKKAYTEIGSMPKNILTRCLLTVAMVNKESALFAFNQSKNEMIVYAVSDSGKSPIKSTCPVENLSNNDKYIWGVQHVMDILKSCKDNNVLFSLPSDGQSFKVVSTVDPNMQFYGMNIDNPKYAKVNLD